MGQLGLGFNSQEGTRGLVEGFEGDGVKKVATGVGSSYLVLREGDQTSLYVQGSLHRGRLGHPSFSPPSSSDDFDPEPSLQLLSKSTKLSLPPSCSNIKDLAVGFEHALLLTGPSPSPPSFSSISPPSLFCSDGNLRAENGEIWGTGCNTDGQLGLGPSSLDDVYEFTKIPLPKEVEEEGGVECIRAGADTSGLITRKGNLWTWGNSEYGQAFHGRIIDQIHSPTPVETSSFLPPSTNRRIRDWRCGGSFSLVLDDRGALYSAGFGALGLGKERLQNLNPSRVEIEGLKEGEGLSRIRAGWGWAVGVLDAGNKSKLWSWGINPSGQLGLGTSTHVCEPQEVKLPLKELGLKEGEGNWGLGEVEVSKDAMWVELWEEEGGEVD